jgi:hypothetical protein
MKSVGIEAGAVGDDGLLPRVESGERVIVEVVRWRPRC